MKPSICNRRILYKLKLYYQFSLIAKEFWVSGKANEGFVTINIIAHIPSICDVLRWDSVFVSHTV